MSDYGHPLDPDHSAIRLAYERGYLVSDDDGVRLPPPWWDDDVLKAPVVAQLRRCLATLED